MADIKIFDKLVRVQKEATAPRSVEGRFGKARSAEKILEAYKPVCNKHGLYLNTSDKVELVGDRNYITATATVTDMETGESYSATASAWEGNVVSGLDTSQVSGKTSSYAKKYALQNLFAIDDTKDADFEHEDAEPSSKEKPAAKKGYKPSAGRPVNDDQRMMITNLLRKNGVEGKDAINEYLWDNFGALPENELEAYEVISSLDAK